MNILLTGGTATLPAIRQSYDVPDTYADVADLVEQFHHQPATIVEEGIKFFGAWYRNEFKLI